MDNGNMDIYDQVRKPPEEALKQIKGGRLKGMTDINPQWRYETMTNLFGPVGVGWIPRIIEHWSETYNNETICSVRIGLRIKINGEWTEEIEGVGGSKLLIQEKLGPHVSDEGYKMAYTDALSVAMKMLGIGSDIYMGRWDGSKYKAQELVKEEPNRRRTQKNNGKGPFSPPKRSKEEQDAYDEMLKIAETTRTNYLAWLAGQKDSAKKSQVKKVVTLCRPGTKSIREFYQSATMHQLELFVGELTKEMAEESEPPKEADYEKDMSGMLNEPIPEKNIPF